MKKEADDYDHIIFVNLPGNGGTIRRFFWTGKDWSEKFEDAMAYPKYSGGLRALFDIPEEKIQEICVSKDDGQIVASALTTPRHHMKLSHFGLWDPFKDKPSEFEEDNRNTYKFKEE